MSSVLDELGFDSLTYNELAAGIEAAGVHVPEGVVFASAHDVASLLDLVTGKRHTTALEKRESRKAVENELLRTPPALTMGALAGTASLAHDYDPTAPVFGDGDWEQ